jgi:hypothetical protein
LSKPGKSSEAGDTLWDALKPPHPAASSKIAGRIIKSEYLQFNFTQYSSIDSGSMLATPNSLGILTTPKASAGFKAHGLNTVGICWLLMVLLINSAFSGQVFAQTNSSAPIQQASRADFAKRAQTTYETARKRYQSSPNDAEAAWQFGRASYDWAEFATTKKQRAEIAEEGIAATQKLVDRQPKLPEGHYYLAMNLGQLAQTKELGALKLVSKMEKEFKASLELNPDLDFAGPDRNLGLLYREAPGWPASVGSKSKAKQHLTAAAKREPEYPENLLNLIEAYLGWGDRSAASRELANLDAIWPKAEQQLTGEQWTQSWIDWKLRREIAEKKASETKRGSSSR